LGARGLRVEGEARQSFFARVRRGLEEDRAGLRV
jgi:hypothetical protein